MEENNFIYENGKIFTSDEDNLHASSDDRISEYRYFWFNEYYQSNSIS